MIAREMLPAAMQEVLAVTLMHRGIDPASVSWMITQQEIERAMRGPDELICVVRERVEDVRRDAQIHSAKCQESRSDTQAKGKKF